jgi:acyl dehydratase
MIVLFGEVLSMEIFRTAESLEAALGREIGPTEWLNIQQSRVDQFAEVTEDRQWIHIDRERAMSGPFGGTVAHGFLTVALIPYMLRSLINIESRMGVNYGLNKVRFPAPVIVESRIRTRATIAEFEKLNGGAIQIVIRNEVEVEGSTKPCCVAELLARHYFG